MHSSYSVCPFCEFIRRLTQPRKKGVGIETYLGSQDPSFFYSWFNSDRK